VSKAAKRERQRQNREAAKVAQEQAAKRARLMSSLRFIGIAVVVVVAVAGIFQLIQGGDDSSDSAATGGVTCSDEKPPAASSKTYTAAPPQTIDPAKAYTAEMETSCGNITLALDPVSAPVATNNFVFLSREGFYDGLTFHRAATDFVIQGGDPKGDGSGGAGYTVAGEVPTDNYPVGALAAAKSGTDPAGTFGSQFFIVTGPNGATLPNDYARFGTVTKGQNVADKIESFAPDTGDGTPTREVYIFKVSITEGAANAADSSTSSTAPAAP
jgi:cyclophilin family peptidyl-prolyl cis-trans isomerase